MSVQRQCVHLRLAQYYTYLFLPTLPSLRQYIIFAIDFWLYCFTCQAPATIETTTRKCCNNFTYYAGGVFCLHLYRHQHQYQILDISCGAACNPCDFIALLFLFSTPLPYVCSFRCVNILGLYLIAIEIELP